MASSAPGAELTIFLLTMGTGSQVWELFGHNAIWLHDPIQGTDLVYNWGVFEFRAPDFLARFLKGNMRYRIDTASIGPTVDQYRYLNRTIRMQELDLDPAQKASLRDFLEWNMRPENQFYRYDYFRDNCSTRTRDALDRVLGGQLRAAAIKHETGTTYRWHALRLMQADKLLAVGADIGLGRPADRRLTLWEEMFLPRPLYELAGKLTITDASGHSRPLVRSERTLFEATSRPPEAEAPPRLFVQLLFVGLALAGLIVGLDALAASGSRAARLGASLAIVLWATIAGLAGLMVTALWTVTDHTFAHRNENLLLFNPLWLVLLVPHRLAARSKRWRKVMLWSTRLLAGLAVMAAILHVAGLSGQSNGPVLGLALPPVLAIAWVVQRRLEQKQVGPALEQLSGEAGSREAAYAHRA